MMTMTLSKMLYGFRMYPNKPKASNMKPISRTNMLVKTMLLISNTSVSSSGWWEKGRGRGGGGWGGMETGGKVGGILFNVDARD